MENNKAVDFWNRVNQLLKEQKKTQIELCNSCGFSLNSFRVKLSNRNAPSVFVAYTIAQYLNTTVEYLVSGNEKDKEKEVLKDKIKRISDICNE